MAIDLLNSFLQKGQNIASGQKSNTTNTAQTTQNLPQNLQVIRAIKALQAGQTIQGEIVSVKGDMVQLAIMKDVLIDARLAQSMNLAPGVTMPFQIKANTSQGLSLIPLFTNIAADPNALKALEMARIPANDRTLEMVQSMMKNGMSIDKQSIQEMYRDVTAFKDAAVRDIINLHQLKMPVSGENLTQLSMYQNNQHYLKDAFSDIGNAIGGQIESLVAEGKAETALSLVKDIQQLFQNSEMMSEASTVAGDKDALIQKPGMPVVLTEEMLLKESNVSLKEGDIPSMEEEVLNERQKPEISGTQNQSEWEDLVKSLFREKESGKISAMFEKIWEKQISKHWLMEPETVMEKEKVKDFYEKLNGQIKELEQIFKENNMEKSPAAKVIQNTSSNLDFMNQLNQMHAYIQLPLKMANQNAHGELYVFANRKNLSKQDGKVTALLHLDMEHLGKMDVYVALENQKVSTNFYLEKEEYLDLLDSHMDMLTARLKKRGYTCDIKTILRNDDSEPVITTIEKQQGQPMLLSMQAFDVRA